MDKNRKTAYLTLLEIERFQVYSNIELNRQIRENSPDSPAFVRELVYGVLASQRYLDHVLNQLIPRGLKGIKKQTLVLLRMGLYQILEMDSVPEYAAVNETVKLARRFAAGREGFINGVLRGYGKKKAQLRMPDKDENPAAYLSIRYSYAPWIVRLWIDQYGRESAEALLAAGNETPQLCIRVNLMKTDRESLKTYLEKKGFQVALGKHSNRVLYVKGGELLSDEAYEKGMFSVQDESSVLSTEILAPQGGETVIDICAAPGGKTLAMAEQMENQGKIYAFDIYPHKLKLLNKEAERLGISIVETEKKDGSIFDGAWEMQADRVLVDAPCSGLGVIRRKPEIKYKEIADQGRALAGKQYEILSCAGRYVKPGGVLLYSTCTVNKIENAEVVTRFLKNHPEFELDRSRQFLPDADGTDGFYLCRMTRKKGPKGDGYGGRL